MNLKSTNNKAKKKKKNLITSELNFLFNEGDAGLHHSHMTFWGRNLTAIKGTICRTLQINRNQEEPRWKKGQSV